MARYRSRAVEVEAVQLRWDTWDEVCEFAGVGRLVDGKPEGTDVDFEGKPLPDHGPGLRIPTLHGLVLALPGEYLLRAKDQLYPVPADVFEQRYAPVPAAPTLLATVGLPYSGKSTWARQQGHPIVCPDAIRRALHGQRFVPEFVWAIARCMVGALFGAGHDTVILDATLTTEERRAEWKDDRWDVQFVEFRTPAEVCRARARAAGDETILPVIERMAAQLTWPANLEWADEQDAPRMPIVVEFVQAGPDERSEP